MVKKTTIITYAKIADDELLKLPMEARSNWISVWAYISSDIAHRKFYNDIYPALKDTRDFTYFAAYYCHNILPHLMGNLSEMHEKIALIIKFEDIINEQVVNQVDRSGLLNSILRKYINVESYDNAFSLFIKNKEYFKDSTVFADI